MAQQTLGIVGSEPLFYGEDTLAHGLSAEDWLRRLDAYRTANPLVNNAVIASLALGWLRGPAALYFAETLLFKDAAVHAAAVTDWTLFRAAFHARYCKIASTADISIDWATLRQRDQESVASFADRICQVMQRYISLLPLPPLPAGQLEPLTAAIADIRAQGADVAARQLVTDLILDNLEQAGRRALRAAITDMATKTLAGGLRNAKLRELVRREERNGVAFLRILDLVLAADRNMDDARAPAQAGKNKSGAAAVAVSGAPTDAPPPGEEFSGVDAIHGGSSRGRGRGASRGGGRGGGRGRGQSHQTGQPSPSSSSRKDKLPTTPCPMCHLMGHWKKHCPLLSNLVPAQATAVGTGTPPPATGHPPPPPHPSQAPPPQMFYPEAEYYARTPPGSGNFYATV